MGWSCREDAAKTLDKISDHCRAKTGMSNSIGTHFYDVSRTEHLDGAITGTIVKVLPNDMCQRSGSFRIEGDGTVTRGPAWMKKAGK